MFASSRTISTRTVHFKPVLPSWNRKYTGPVNREAVINGLNATIPAFARASSLSDCDLRSEGESEWEELVHPEGNRYWHNARSQIVTPNNPYQSKAVLELLLIAHSQATALFPASRYLDGGTEVFLSIEGDNAPVEYYFVDHEARQVFWAQDADVARMGLDSFGPDSVLKSALTPEYWTHVEYFPGHRLCDLKAEDELINVLRFGCIDDLTAPGSISPYSAGQCFDYLKIFEGFRSLKQDRPNGYRTLSLARLWASIARIRHIHSYGLSNPRLDRLQGLPEFVKLQSKSSWALSLWEGLCLYIPRRTLGRLNELWNGRVVYERHWRAFFEDIKREWLVMGGVGLALLIASAVVLALGGTSVALMASASCAIASVLLSLLLLQGHAKNRLSTAPQISSYIVKIEDYNHGLRPLSLIFAVPHALTIYSALLLQIGLFYTSLGNGSGTGNHSEGLALAVWVLPVLVPTILVGYYGGGGVL